MEDKPSSPMRTDECARRIEYVTHGKWTPDQYKSVCSIIRLYRHESIIGILDRAAGAADDSGGKVMGIE